MPQAETSDLRDISKGAEEVIFRVNGFFPFDFFPDSISVDKNKIDIVYRHFFWTKRLFTILLEDLTTIKLTTGPIFATIFFEVRGYETNPDPVTYILKSEAIKFRDIVVGLTKAKRENLTVNKPTGAKVRLLEKIGDAHEDIRSAI